MLETARIRWNKLAPTSRRIVGASLVIGAAAYALVLIGEPQSPTTMAVDLGAKLLIVLALIFAAGQLLRAMNGRTQVADSKRTVTVLEVTHLANNRSLYVVSVEGKRMVLGVTPQSITPITEIGTQDVIS